MADDKPQFEVFLRHVVFSFPKLFRPEGFKGDEGSEKKYQLTGLIPKDAPGAKEMWNAILDASDDALDDHAKRNKGERLKIKEANLCFHDGDDDDYSDIEGYAGHYFIRSSNTKRPTVKDADGRTPLVEEDGKIYGGCIGNMIVRLWVQDNKYGRRVNGSLEGAQFVRDGKAFGAAPLREDAFSDETGGKGSGRDRDRDGGRDRGNDRGRDRDESRGSDRDSRSDDRGSRGGREESEGRSRDRDRDSRDERGSDRGGRDRDEGRGRDRDDRDERRSRDRDDDRPRDRDRDGDRDRRSVM